MTASQMNLEEMRKRTMLGGGEKRIADQHAKGKLTARERLEILLDAGTFVEIGAFVQHRAVEFGMAESHPLGDGVVTGWGKIDNRPVYVFAQDFTVMGGSVGEAHARKIANLLDLAVQNGAPVIAMNDSGGARIQEGVNALAGYGSIFYRNVQASGVIPQISVMLGPSAGGAVYSPGITDFIFMVEKTAYMYITGPDVVRTVTHEDVGHESLGGAVVHASQSGVAHVIAADEKTLLDQVRWLLSYLPSNNLAPLPYLPTGDTRTRLTPEVGEIVPPDPQKPYDVRQVIEVLVDNGEFFEIQAEFAGNLVVGFARMEHSTVGIIANQPDNLAGVLDIDASDKGARFIRFCDAFHIPLLTLVDTPGFLPGSAQEHGGIIRHGAKLIYAYAEATVPKISLILRKAYGGAYIVMSSKTLGGDVNLALPNAEIAVMGPEAAVKIVYRKALDQADDREAREKDLARQYREELANPYFAAARGYVDDVIQPDECRTRILLALESLRDKRQGTPNRKHGNIPL